MASSSASSPYPLLFVVSPLDSPTLLARQDFSLPILLLPLLLLRRPGIYTRPPRARSLPSRARVACLLHLLDSVRVLAVLMDRSVPSSAAAGASSPRCRFDAVLRVCGRCGAVAGEAAGWVLGALLTCVFAVVGSLVGIFIGGCMGMSTESGMFRGAGVGAVSGAVFSIEAVESCIEIWKSSESGKYSILFVLDIISSLFSGRIVWEKVSPALQRAVQSQMSLMSTPFIDNNDLFETGGTGGMSRDLINEIPMIRFSAAVNSDQETDKSCCSVCLQDFESRQFVRALPQCQHMFHVQCIDNWLLRTESYIATEDGESLLRIQRRKAFFATKLRKIRGWCWSCVTFDGELQHMVEMAALSWVGTKLNLLCVALSPSCCL